MLGTPFGGEGAPFGGEVPTDAKEVIQFGRPAAPGPLELTTCLEVAVIAAKNLPSPPAGGERCNPYCIVKFRDETQRTLVRGGEPNPVFGEEVSFMSPAQVPEVEVIVMDWVPEVEVIVMDWDRRGNDRVVGRVVVSPQEMLASARRSRMEAALEGLECADSLILEGSNRADDAEGRKPNSARGGLALLSSDLVITNTVATPRLMATPRLTTTGGSGQSTARFERASLDSKEMAVSVFHRTYPGMRAFRLQGEDGDPLMERDQDGDEMEGASIMLRFLIHEPESSEDDSDDEANIDREMESSEDDSDDEANIDREAPVAVALRFGAQELDLWDDADPKRLAAFRRTLRDDLAQLWDDADPKRLATFRRTLRDDLAQILQVSRKRLKVVAATPKEGIGIKASLVLFPLWMLSTSERAKDARRVLTFS
ncbi:hypothetical protein T484DRAFT_1778791 [Baffinella frigidus]|nr:hypothetical protein T484DRAFT_1778791 [Cryptophyta sp. CCMP2293]